MVICAIEWDTEKSERTKNRIKENLNFNEIECLLIGAMDII
jgi:uncharacterized DUF497 family protein